MKPLSGGPRHTSGRPLLIRGQVCDLYSGHTRGHPTGGLTSRASRFLVWWGIVACNKVGGSRASHKGYFRHQCEFIVWGARGACPQATYAGPFSGCFPVKVRKAEKFHLTGKPTELLRELVQVDPSGSRILAPFAGSGTTLAAAQDLDRRADGIEREAEYCEIARERLQPEVCPTTTRLTDSVVKRLAA